MCARPGRRVCLKFRSTYLLKNRFTNLENSSTQLCRRTAVNNTSPPISSVRPSTASPRLSQFQYALQANRALYMDRESAIPKTASQSIPVQGRRGPRGPLVQLAKIGVHYQLFSKTCCTTIGLYSSHYIGYIGLIGKSAPSQIDRYLILDLIVTL